MPSREFYIRAMVDEVNRRPAFFGQRSMSEPRNLMQMARSLSCVGIGGLILDQSLVEKHYDGLVDALSYIVEQVKETQ